MFLSSHLFPCGTQEAAGDKAISGPEPSGGNSEGLPSEGHAVLYDRVLVDAECTHDGSMRHMTKLIAQKWEDFDSKCAPRANTPISCSLLSPIIGAN